MGLPWNDPNSNPLQDMLDYYARTEKQFKQLYFGEWLTEKVEDDADS